MRISDWSSDVCSSDLKGWILGRAIGDGDRVIEFLGAQALVGHRVVDRQEITVVGQVDRGADRLQHDAVAILKDLARGTIRGARGREDDEGLRSEEQTTELMSQLRIPNAFFYLKKKTKVSQAKKNHPHN